MRSTTRGSVGVVAAWSKYLVPSGSGITVLQNLPEHGQAMFSVWFLLQRRQFHVLLTKHASAFLSTGIFGVRRTLGHPSTKPAMDDVGAELGLVFAQPGFQHQQQSST